MTTVMKTPPFSNFLKAFEGWCGVHFAMLKPTTFIFKACSLY